MAGTVSHPESDVLAPAPGDSDACEVAKVEMWGQELPGKRKWLGGAFVANGEAILGVPANSGSVLRLDVTNGEVSFLPGPDMPGKFKYLRGIRAPDGSVYGIPACAGELGVLRVTVEGEVTFLAQGTLPAGEWMWHGAALGRDGNIYAIPANAEQVLRVDTKALTVSLIGPKLHPGLKNKWYGGIMAPDGSIWGIPYNAPACLKIVPETGEITEVGDFGAGGWKWHGGCRCGDHIIGIPSHAEQVLRITPTTGELTLLDGRYEGKYKWGGCVADAEGIVWGVPSDHDHVIRVDPVGGTTELLPEVARGVEGSWSRWVGSEYRNKWQGGVYSKADGQVYCIPCDAAQILVLNPRTRALSMLGELGDARHKFQGCATGPDGTIWALPESCPHIMRITPHGTGHAVDRARAAAAAAAAAAVAAAASAGAAPAARPTLKVGGEACECFDDEPQLSRLRADSRVEWSALADSFEWSKLCPGGGKGGNLMAFTPCRRYLVKEVNATDHNCMLTIATRYVEHILNESGADHRDSLLARIFAHVRRPSTGKVYLIMNNWLPPTRAPAEGAKAPLEHTSTLCIYDLKGTADDKTVVRNGEEVPAVHKRVWKAGMWVGKSRWSAARTAYYDGKVSARGVQFACTATQKEWLDAALARDCAFLAQHRLMDYSLIISTRVLPGDVDVATAVDAAYRGTSPELGPRMPLLARAGADGPVAVTYFGIIDFLQPWGFMKKVARVVKTMEANKSTEPPGFYAKRFEELGRKFAPEGQLEVAAISPASPQAVEQAAAPRAEMAGVQVEIKEDVAPGASAGGCCTIS